MYNISEHIKYYEATRSDVAKRLGIQNVPDKDQLANMIILAEEVYEPLVRYFGVPIYISSFFRTAKLNVAMGGSDTSQHVKGEAMDLDADFYNRISNRDIFEFIKENLEFDQLIWEGGNNEEPSWVHVSFSTHRRNRKQILKLNVNAKD